MTINVFMVRHGQTYLNKYQRMQGWTNAPLTEKGVADAKLAGTRLAQVPFAGAYASDMARAEQTARFILAANQTPAVTTVTTTANFREQFFGSFDGLLVRDAELALADHLHRPLTPYMTLLTEFGGDAMMDLVHTADPTGDAENAKTFWSRVEQGLADILAQHQDGDNVLLVVHGVLLVNLIARFGNNAYPGIEPDNGSVTKWQLADDGMTLTNFNDSTTIWS